MGAGATICKPTNMGKRRVLEVVVQLGPHDEVTDVAAGRGGPKVHLWCIGAYGLVLELVLLVLELS